MRRHFLAVAGAAGLLLAATGAPLRAYEYQQIFGQPLAGMEGRPRAVARPREVVAYNGRYAPGTIVISTEERRLITSFRGIRRSNMASESAAPDSNGAAQGGLR